LLRGRVSGAGRWLGRVAADPVERRSVVTVQLFCLGLLAVLVANVLGAIVSAGGPSARVIGEEPATLVSIGAVVAALVLIRRRRVQAGYAVLCASMVAVLGTSLVLRGVAYHVHFLPRVFGIVLALPALLLGRRALWISLAVLVAGAAFGVLREQGVLWPMAPLPPETSPLGTIGAVLATMVLFAIVMDRFGAALSVALRASIARQHELEAEAARRREAQMLLVQTRKMEALGRLSAGVAHDFNNILTSILGCTALCRRALPAGSPERADLDEIEEASRRGAELTRRLLAFAREQPTAPRLIQVETVTRSMLPMLRRLVGDQVEIELRMSPTPGVVHMDPTQLEQVLVNLAVNARDAMPSGGTLTIETTVTDDAVGIEVRDSGVGMDEATRLRAFEPFFTTKERGTGLGLATCYGIVRQAGGEITVDSAPGAGTTFRLRLPRASGVPAQRDRRAAAPPEGGEETILVVEDELSVRAATVRALGALGYQTLEARDPVDAEAVAARHRGPIHLLLADLGMRDGGGWALAERLRARRPELRVLFMSGSPAELTASGGPERPFIAKPFSAAEIGPRLRAVLDGS
jgi:signal transduction histidine kinase